jgi:hypothetical protein
MTIKDALKIAGLAVGQLGLIQSLTKVGGTAAGQALGAIGAIVNALQSGFDGHTTPEQVEANLAELLKQIAINDAIADAALADRFRT